MEACFYEDADLWNLSCDIAAESVLDSMHSTAFDRVPSDFRQEMYDRLEAEVKVLTAEKIYRYLSEHASWTAQKDGEEPDIPTSQNEESYGLPETHKVDQAPSAAGLYDESPSRPLIPEVEMLLGRRNWERAGEGYHWLGGWNLYAMADEFRMDDHGFWERLEDRKALPALYREIGQAFRGLDSWSEYIITSYEDAERYIGKKADKNRKIYNGMIKTYFYQYIGPKPPARRPAPEGTGRDKR